MRRSVDDIEAVVRGASESDVLDGSDKTGGVADHRVHVVQQNVHALVAF